jgi:SAM-dependent methyltransferase
MNRNRQYARELAKEYLSKGEPLAWFEKLYADGQSDFSLIPWADFRPNPNLVDFVSAHRSKLGSGSCLVIGCGLGDDAEYLSSLGFDVDSFDISPTAIRICQQRFPDSKVRYFVDDITDFRTGTHYDFVFESYTMQVLPGDLRAHALKLLPALLNENGLLLFICRAREKDEAIDHIPWPLTIDELDPLKNSLTCISFEDYCDANENSEVRRFRILYQKQSSRQNQIKEKRQ